MAIEARVAADAATEDSNPSCDGFSLRVLHTNVVHGREHPLKRRLQDELETPRSRHKDKKVLLFDNGRQTQIALESPVVGEVAIASLSEEPPPLVEEEYSAMADPQAPLAVASATMQGLTTSLDRGLELVDRSSPAASVRDQTPQSTQRSNDDTIGPTTTPATRAAKGSDHSPVNDELVDVLDTQSTVVRARTLSNGCRAADVPMTPGPANSLPSDLLSFQTPGPSLLRRSQHPSSALPLQLERFHNQKGEEFLLDITPRMYSPQSIPLYTLRDLEVIKAGFEEARRDLEGKMQNLHEQLAQTVSNKNHHAALTAQGESLHAEYSKKHVKKVTALKKEWELKMHERTAAKDEVLAEKDRRIAELEQALATERQEKQEVIAMSEELLCIVGAKSPPHGPPVQQAAIDR